VDPVSCVLEAGNRCGDVLKDPRHPGDYEVIDGNWRREAAQDAGLTHLPAIILLGLSDEDALAKQLQANAVRHDTTRMEYCRQLRRIEKSRPGISMTERARLAGKNVSWV
jgi:ParB-like chromosome segregation protein Spo0J